MEPNGVQLGVAAEVLAAASTLFIKAPVGITPLQEIGQGWIRTSEGVKPADLQSAPFGHSGTYPWIRRVDIGSRFTGRK